MSRRVQWRMRESTRPFPFIVPVLRGESEDGTRRRLLKELRHMLRSNERWHIYGVDLTGMTDDELQREINALDNFICGRVGT